ncbi:MAG: CHAT domain-containing protein [Methylococcaceae bacterium]
MSLIELNIRFPDKDQVIVKFKQEESQALAFKSPMTKNKKALEDLLWYIEIYAAEYTGEPDDEEAKRIEANLIILGEALFQSIFTTDAALALFHKFQQQHADRLLTIQTDDPEILALPWELLRRPQSTFLFDQQPRISIRRYCVKSHSPIFTIQAKPKLRLLFIVSRPNNASFLDPRLDPQAVLDALTENDIAQIEVEFLRPATLRKLVERLENKDLPPVDIIHFDGHGVYDETEQLGYLLFETRGAGHFVTSAQLAELLVPHYIALVVLSACQSATIGHEPLGSVAAGLTDKGVPTVLAMVYSVLVQTTRQLFAAFYQQLATGQGIGAALDYARQALASKNQRGTRRRGEGEFELTLQDWFVPALYSTRQNDVLLQSNAPKIAKAALCHDLPALQAAGFFGRCWELWQIERGFVQGVERITITGFGGEGKTYLAIEAGHWLLQTDLFDAVCFVDFSRYQGLDALRYALNALGVLLGATLLDENAVPPLLQTRQLLWVWDNLESLAAETLDELLTVAARWSAQCRFLFTTWQHRFTHADYDEGNSKHGYVDLSGLAEPDALAYFNRLWQSLPLPERPYPARYELITLFSKVAFHPLSIGLLAQQLKIRTIGELGERLEALLVGENNTLLTSLKLSLERLPSDQRELVKRLGVFQGGAIEDMLLKITEINKSEWVKLRPALERTGLIQVEDLNPLGIKYPYLKFHPTLVIALWQELTTEQLHEFTTRYRFNYAQLSAYLYDEGSKNLHAVNAIALRELPNLLCAVYAVLKANEGFAMNFVTEVNFFLNVFSLQRDKSSLLEAAQQVSGDIGSYSWFLIQINKGEALYYAGYHAQAESIFQTLLKQLGQKPCVNLCNILGCLGRCCYSQGKTANAIDYYVQGLTVAQSLETTTSIQRLIAIQHIDLADAFMNEGDYAQAKERYMQSLAIINEIGDIRCEAVVKGQLGTLAMRKGDLQAAEQYYQTELKLLSSLNEPESEAIVWNKLGRLYKQAGSLQQSEQTYRKSLALGNLAGAPRTGNNLANAINAQGKLDAAESWYRKVITMLRQGNPKELATGLHNLADLLHNQVNRLNEAWELAEEALAIKKNLNETSAEIWMTYSLLAKIFAKQEQCKQSAQYRKLARDSYLRFAGMPYQMKQHARLIAFVLLALKNTEERLNLEIQLKQAPETWTNLVNAIQHILNGEREEVVLLEPLDFEESANIHLILKGIESPESLETLFDS